MEQRKTGSAEQQPLQLNNHRFNLNPREQPLFDRTDPQIKEDIIRMILQYLHEEGLSASRVTLHDESNVKWRESEETSAELRKLKKLIQNGDWVEIEKLTVRNGPLFLRHNKSLLYALLKQQYLELIDNREYQKAFAFLNKRLKPFEALEQRPGEFRDLCYLLTATSIQDVPSFRSWNGVIAAREALIDQFQSVLHFELGSSSSSSLMTSSSAMTSGAISLNVPESRLITLLQQAVAFQIESARYHPSISPRVNTLLYDYQTLVIPNKTRHILTGHGANVKCVEWVCGFASSSSSLSRYISTRTDEQDTFSSPLNSTNNINNNNNNEMTEVSSGMKCLVASGGSDSTVKLWDAETGTLLDSSHLHTSRIWDLSSIANGSLLTSASADGSVKVWDTSSGVLNMLNSTQLSTSDLYSIQIHPAHHHYIAGGYDKTLRLVEMTRGEVVCTFSGHQLSITSCLFNTYGNLVISGSKDNSVKFWDTNSSTCVRTLPTHLGEVTSVAVSSNGTLLLSSSKDNSIRLWDMRMMTRPVRRFKGHQNTCKNFIRAQFASTSLIISGSEDGRVNVWDIDQKDPIQRLEGHSGAVYQVKWNAKQSEWISCSDDCTLRLWWLDTNNSNNSKSSSND